MRECCEHCTLPLAGRVVVARLRDRDGRFCCYGCVLAHQITGASGQEGEASTILIRLGLAIFFAMNVMAVSLPTYAPYVYGGEAELSEGSLFIVFRYLAMIFAAPVLLLLGWPVVRSYAAGDWRNGPTTDALILIGAGAAFSLSVVHTWKGAGPVYYDTAVMVLLLVTLGRYLEARVRADAGRRVRADLRGAPTQAARLEGGDAVLVDVADLRPGDLVRVVAGEMFPTDGVVEAGSGSVDHSMMSGVARPVRHEPGSEVAGGTCSLDASFDVRVSRPASESALAQIERLLDQARATASPIERSAEGVVRIFLPLTVALAVFAGLWHGSGGGADRGILVALSVLVVACPCAFGIATPVALWFGVAAAARRGIVVRDASVLERVSEVTAAFLDKTGTLSERTPRLVGCEVATGVDSSERQLLSIAAALEAGQRHPLARAVVGAASRHGVEPAGRAHDVVAIPGMGVRGVVGGQTISIGTPAFAAGDGIRLECEEGDVLIWSQTEVLGRLSFAEALRPQAEPATAELAGEVGVRTAILSGDSAVGPLTELSAAPAIEVGLSPRQKMERVLSSRRAGETVLFVGDGINDAPALTAADVGLAFGDPADLPRLAADALCLSDDLTAVPWLVRHARRVVAIVRQNLVFAFGYNAVAIGCAIAGRLDPLIAAVSMLASSILVVVNARRCAPLQPTLAAGETDPPALDDQSALMPSSSILR